MSQTFTLDNSTNNDAETPCTPRNSASTPRGSLDSQITMNPVMSCSFNTNYQPSLRSEHTEPDNKSEHSEDDTSEQVPEHTEDNKVCEAGVEQPCEPITEQHPCEPFIEHVVCELNVCDLHCGDVEQPCVSMHVSAEQTPEEHLSDSSNDQNTEAPRASMEQSGEFEYDLHDDDDEDEGDEGDEGELEGDDGDDGEEEDETN